MSNDLKLEQLKALFKCQFCSELLVQPITLPCGISICDSHLDELSSDRCQFCEEQHPKNRYRVNQKLNKMIELQVNSIKLSPKFDACKENINKAKDLIDKIDLVSKDPDNFIHEYFEHLKRKVDIRREDLKLKIDDYSNEIVSKIDQTQKDCIKMAKEIDAISKDIVNYKTDLNTIIQSFDSFEFNDEKHDDIITKVNILLPKFEGILDEYIYSLLDNNDYRFEVENTKMENVFGSFIRYPGGKVNSLFF